MKTYTFREYVKIREAIIKPNIPVAQHAPSIAQPAPAKLDASTGINGVVSQYISAFQKRLDMVGPQDPSITQTINTTSNTLKFKYGQAAADFFVKKAQWLIQNNLSYRNALANRKTA